MLGINMRRGGMCPRTGEVSVLGLEVSVLGLVGGLFKDMCCLGIRRA